VLFCVLRIPPFYSKVGAYTASFFPKGGDRGDKFAWIIRFLGKPRTTEVWIDRFLVPEEIGTGKPGTTKFNKKYLLEL